MSELPPPPSLSSTPIDDSRCLRHPNRSTGRQCTRCGSPACSECLVRGSIGSLCVACRKASTPSATTRMRYWQASQGVLIAKILIGLNLAVFAATAAIDSRALNGSLTQLQIDLGLNSSLVAQGPAEWYRIVSSGFIHFGLLHFGFNMYLLYQLGGMLEVALGRVQMLLLYVACLAGGSFGALLLQPDGLHGGASGAVFGLMGVTAMAYQQRGINPMRTQIGTLLLLNLAITFLVPGISIGGHLGGAATGALSALVVTAPRQTAVRKERQLLLLVAIFLAAAAGCIVIVG
ncbi:MAG TPA: rhomboid family intramembrane serine protease [Acidimicrobiaceae bacterium]|nr:rhomboid family intramembrane serine protease [Acidimicrobiaceae bacterium]